MIPVLTASSAKAYDQFLIDTVCINSSLLMERAATALFDQINLWLRESPDSQIVIFSGRGNNGGDGIALARLLTLQGVAAQLVIVGDQSKLALDAARELELLTHTPDAPKAMTFDPSMDLALDETKPLIIVDALLGTGASGPLREEIKEAVEFLNELAQRFQARVLAVDVPTGLDADTGDYQDGSVVLATTTVTIAAQKLGFYRHKISQITGEVVVAHLADREDLQPKSFIHVIERQDVIDAYPTPSNIASKFDFGSVLTVCGSRGMTGAAIMGAESALRSGCGLVTVATASSERYLVAEAMPELMTIGLDETANGAPTVKAWDQLESFIKKADVLLIGSGTKPEAETADLFRKILRDVEKPIIADAGALHAVAEDLEILRARKFSTILTPHSGELAKLMHLDRNQVERDRMNYARKFAMEFRVTVVIKGAPTFTISPDGDVFINSTGNVGLATAGSGDVLGGMIAGTFARMTDRPTEAGWIATYLHGAAADLAKEEWTTVGMTARDVTKQLGATFRSMGFE